EEGAVDARTCDLETPGRLVHVLQKATEDMDPGSEHERGVVAEALRAIGDGGRTIQGRASRALEETLEALLIPNDLWLGSEILAIEGSEDREDVAGAKRI